MQCASIGAVSLPKQAVAEMRDMALCQQDALLRRIVIAAGLCWSFAFVAIALSCQLELYGDGAMFSYAVAVQDVWAFHWHNISGRTSVYLLALLPAETLVAITGNPWAGIVAYGFLFYVAPLAGLAATYAADRSPGRTIFLYACGSTALLCPLIFGFPTEMWFAHAIFWPTLALSHYATSNILGAVLVLAAWLLLAFTHEGAFVLLFAVLATLALRGLRSAPFRRGAANLFVIAILAVTSKNLFPPDEYYADAFMRAALHFFDPALFRVEIAVELLAAITVYVATLKLISIWLPKRACPLALALLLALLSIFWLGFDHSVHANSRYYMRTALVIGTPLLGILGALAAMTREGLVVDPPVRFQHALVSSPHGTCALASILFAVTLIHAIETAKFVTAWSCYRDVIATLAMSQDSDPALGDPRFVSSKRGPPELAPLEWFSTIPYLSAILSNFQPNRLVIDPSGNYFWLSCATATHSTERHLVVPLRTRQLIRTYSCLHR
jgi:hypothetical protein